MKRIYLNLKRFDIPPALGGVNRLCPLASWGRTIVTSVQDSLSDYSSEALFTAFFPEAHILGAAAALGENSPLIIGCQGVHRADTQVGGNFGAFTTLRTANAMKAAGCGAAIIGHCEERRDKWEIMQAAGVSESGAVSKLLNAELRCAQNAGLEALYCIGESAKEQARWQETLSEQLDAGLEGLNTGSIAIAYEPIWAIGPGKTPPDREYIEKIAQFVKQKTGGLPLVYGGGLKAENARMLASIPEIDGGLIALTRFSGEIGFYPEEYLAIIKTYLER